MCVVFLLCFFTTSCLDLINIGDDDIITSIYMSRIGRLCLTRELLGYDSREATESETAGINDIPFAFDVVWEKCFHRE